MKRIIIFLLLVFSLFMLVGCEGEPTAAVTASVTAAEASGGVIAVTDACTGAVSTVCSTALQTQRNGETTAAVQKSAALKAKESTAAAITTAKPDGTSSAVKAPEPVTAGKTVAITIDCRTVLKNYAALNESKRPFVPESGFILEKTAVPFEPGESVWDVTLRACRENTCSDGCDYCRAGGIQTEISPDTGFGSAYVKGIHQLYEKDCGPRSGWMFQINGEWPDAGADSVFPAAGDEIRWVYTCSLGEDIGAQIQ